MENRIVVRERRWKFMDKEELWSSLNLHSCSEVWEEKGRCGWVLNGLGFREVGEECLCRDKSISGKEFLEKPICIL